MRRDLSGSGFAFQRPEAFRRDAAADMLLPIVPVDLCAHERFRLRRLTPPKPYLA
jgi:hypothetical protein